MASWRFSLGRPLAYHLSRANHSDMLSPAPMPFKTIRPPAGLARLSGFSVLGFTGADAGAFLQAQLMNDVAALADRQWQWNGWLNPKGRLIVFFALLRVADGEFLAVLPDYPAAELQPMLQRFVFRSKVKLAVPTWEVAGSSIGAGRDDAGNAPDFAVGDPASGLRLDFSGESIHRDLWLLPPGHAAPVDAVVDDAWYAQDLAHGLPRLSLAQREAWTPQMLSLGHLRAFSLRKGCYPGQEIVARTHYLGQARREALQVLGRGLAEGAAIIDAGGSTIGSVISATRDGAVAAAVVRTGQTVDTVTVSGSPVSLVPFVDGLQRPA